MKHYAYTETGLYFGQANYTLNQDAFIVVPDAPEVPSRWIGTEWEPLPPEDDTRGYREKRRDAYNALGIDPGFENAIGDFIDDLSKAFDASDLIEGTDLQLRIDQFNAIKEQFPKDE